MQLSIMYEVYKVDRYLSSAFGGRRGGEQRELYYVPRWLYMFY